MLLILLLKYVLGSAKKVHANIFWKFSKHLTLFKVLPKHQAFDNSTALQDLFRIK